MRRAAGTGHFLLLALGAIVPCFGQAGRAELLAPFRIPPAFPSKGQGGSRGPGHPIRYSAVSDERGEYHILGLPAGQYVLTVEQPGFRTLSAVGHHAAVGATGPRST